MSKAFIFQKGEWSKIKDWVGNSKSGHGLNGISYNGNHEREKHDFYATNPHSVDIFLERIKKDNIVLPKTIHEPACGQGHISKELEKHGYNVVSSDLYDYGYGKSGLDFLKSIDKADCFFTNPPYRFALQFVEKSVENLKPDGMSIMYLKIQFLEGKERNLFFKKHPPKYVYVNSSRQMCAKNGDFGGSHSNLMCYAWYIWDKNFHGDTIIRWID